MCTVNATVGHARWCREVDDRPALLVEPSNVRPSLTWLRCARCGAVSISTKESTR